MKRELLGLVAYVPCGAWAAAPGTSGIAEFLFAVLREVPTTSCAAVLPLTPQRKVDNMTRLMLGGDRRSGEGAKPRKENRRETWCPGAGALAG